MKILLPLILIATSLQAEDCDYLRESMEESMDMHRTGAGCDDGIFNAISASMVGWGVGLFAGIALLTGLFNSHSTSTSTTDSSTNNN